MNDELFKAILSLDAYNRGYDAGINLIGTYIGNAQLIDESVSLDTQTETGRDQSIGFFAQAYAIDLGNNNTEINISYRGTNTFVEALTGFTLPSVLDINHGWSLANNPLPGLPNTDSEQGMMAVEFYKYIVDTYTPSEEYRNNSEITLTGHSLGGGLAGFVSTLYGLGDNDSRVATKIFDTMTYDQAAKLASSYNVNWHDAENSYEGVKTPDELYTLQIDPNVTVDNYTPYDTDLYDLVYGDSPPAWENDRSGIEGYAIDGEPLDWELVGRTGNDEKYLYDLGFIEESYGLDTLKLHSIATLAIRMFANEPEVNSNYWEFAAQYFWPVMYDPTFAEEIGMDHASLYGKNQTDEDYAAILRTIIAYSAINEGARVFGDTGIRAFYNDANQLGEALSLKLRNPLYADISVSVSTYAEEISKAFIQYAGELAASKILEYSTPTAVHGILDYSDINHDILTVNFIGSDWFPIATDLKDTIAVARNGLVEEIFQDYTITNPDGINLDEFIENNNWLTYLPGQSSGETFNRVIFATLESGSDEQNLEEVGESLKGTLFVGSIGDDTLTLEAGSDDRTVFIGNGGNDTFFGGDDLDIAIGDDGEDVFDGGGAADFLYGAGGNDVLVGGTGFDIVIGGTGDDTFIAGSGGDDVYHGGYTREELASFWNYDPFDVNKDIARINDGTDTVDYSGLTGVAFDVTLIDPELHNYWVDKYYGGTLYQGVNDRDYLYSIETLDIDPNYRHDAGGIVVTGDANDNTLNYTLNGGGNYNVAYSFYGYGGEDNITGGFMEDLIVGGADDDDLSGSKGADTYYYQLGDGDDFINDFGFASEIDTILLGEGINPNEVSLGRYDTDRMTITFIDNHTITVDNQNYGSLGIDFIKFFDGTIWDMQGTLVPVYGTSGIDTLVGTNEFPAYREGSLIHDEIYAGAGNDKIYGRGGDDLIYCGDGNDNPVQGDAGNDTIYGEGGDDYINGGDDNDTIYGGADNDTIYGGTGNDILLGESGNDTIKGGSGVDVIAGGSGLDTMWGEGGSDIFVFEFASAFQNIDIIKDFSLVQFDAIDLYDILDGFYDYGQEDITNFVQILDSGTSSVLSVDYDGGGDNFVQIATLLSITGITDEGYLESSGRLITHV